MDGRRSHFVSSGPLLKEPTLKLEQTTVNGPLPFVNPTQARYTRIPQALESQPSTASAEIVLPSKIQYKYTTRNNRKGRHALVVSPAQPENGHLVATPKPTNRPSAVLHGILRMLTYFPYWDVSWLVAVVFTFGSVVWVLNSFFALLPLSWPSTAFSNEILYGGGITAFIGATIFEIGSVLLMLEAFNENKSGCFGWAIEKLYDRGDLQDPKEESVAALKIAPSRNGCTHHHRKKKAKVSEPAEIENRTLADLADSKPEGDFSWVWWLSLHDLREKHLRDLGFWACSVQMAAATIFWVSGLTALPGIIDHMSQPILDVFYWTPQVVGGLGFVISGLLFMVETQKRWWLPALSVLGWHIGFWNCIGGIGFFLCPCFGYIPAHWGQLQASIATFWGSWAFLIGSALQWYESLEKHPVEVRNLHQD